MRCDNQEEDVEKRKTLCPLLNRKTQSRNLVTWKHCSIFHTVVSKPKPQSQSYSIRIEF